MSFREEEEDKLRNTKTAAVLHCKQLQQKCEIQEEEMERLREKNKTTSGRGKNSGKLKTK